MYNSTNDMFVLQHGVLIISLYRTINILYVLFANHNNTISNNDTIINHVNSLNILSYFSFFHDVFTNYPEVIES